MKVSSAAKLLKMKLPTAKIIMKNYHKRKEAPRIPQNTGRAEEIQNTDNVRAPSPTIPAPNEPSPTMFCIWPQGGMMWPRLPLFMVPNFRETDLN